MQANRSRDTGPELVLRRGLRAAGERGYRVQLRPIPGSRTSVDIAFTKAKVAVMVDGCFWHGCPEHCVESKTNVDYWAPKIKKNRERDLAVDEMLSESGWTVVRIWEHELPSEGISKVLAALRQARSQPLQRKLN